MTKHVNKSARVIHVDEHMMVPGIPVDLGEVANRPSVKALIESGDIGVDNTKAAAVEEEDEKAAAKTPTRPGTRS